MILDPKKCPFAVGDKVVYKPSSKGLESDVMSDGASKLCPGRVYEVTAIVKDSYVVVAGYHHPGGGLYWTEFQKAGIVPDPSRKDP